ncbi:MAG: RNA polymerase sigma factor [Oscillospiraceae bacterium]|nr:RNA polymerase sigma factor [Oscillospiraceae bacterium]
MLEKDEERDIFAEFYNAHRGRCLKVALSITKNKAWAEEAVHEAFLRMIRHKEKYFSDPCKRTGTLIVIMVKSAALNKLEQENRLDHALLEDVEPFVGDGLPDVFRIVAGKEAANRLQYHISQLDPINKSLIEMKCLLGKTDCEIAELIGSNKNATAVRIHRLRRKLYDSLRKEGFIDD